jgi:hypothetical protein
VSLYLFRPADSIPGTEGACAKDDDTCCVFDTPSSTLHARQPLQSRPFSSLLCRIDRSLSHSLAEFWTCRYLRQRSNTRPVRLKQASGTRAASLPRNKRRVKKNAWITPDFGLSVAVSGDSRGSEFWPFDVSTTTEDRTASHTQTPVKTTIQYDAISRSSTRIA